MDEPFANEHPQFLSRDDTLALMLNTLPFHLECVERTQEQLLAAIFVYLHRFDERTDQSAYLPASYVLTQTHINVVFHRPIAAMQGLRHIEEHAVFNDYGLDAVGQLRWYRFNHPRVNTRGILSESGKFPKSRAFKDIYMEVFEDALAQYSSDQVFNFLYQWKNQQEELGLEVTR